MKTKDAITHFNSVTQSDIYRYACYLTDITPQTAEERFQRWLFSYASVHTTWQLNCKLYCNLSETSWIGNRKELEARIIDSRAGFYNKRVDYICEFTDYYWKHPDWFLKSKHEDWLHYRDRIRAVAPGIGPAKGSFVVELIYPLAAEVVCVDTHIQQLYGYPPSVINKKGIRDKDTAEIEQHWVKQCLKRGIPPVVARWLYWDRKQGQPDSRYWSFVLERGCDNGRGLAEFARSA
jgi:hypothetical protein